MEQSQHNAPDAAQGRPQPVPSVPQPMPGPASQPTEAQRPQAAIPADQPATDQPHQHKVHHAFIWLGGLRTLFIVLWIMVISTFSSVVGVVASISGNSSVGREYGLRVAIVIAGAIIAVLVIAALCFVVRWVQWRHFWYQFDPAEFSIYSGVISKKRTHVPYGRVQSVDQKATLIQRILGLCAVSIDTAGGASNKAILVPYVTKSQAESLRQQLYVRKAQLAAGASGVAAAAPGAGGGAGMAAGAAAPAGAVAAAAGASATSAAPAGTAEGNLLDAASQITDQMTGVFDGPSLAQQAPSFEYGLTNKQLLLTGLFNNTSFVVVAIGLLAAAGQLLQGVADLVPNSEFVLESAVEATVAREGALMAGGVMIGAFLVFALVMWGISAVGTILSYGGFKARRRGDRVEVERGILQHSFQGVAIDRVQSVIISQTLVRRLMGYCEISLGKIDAAAEGSNESSGKKGATQTGRVVVHPFVKKSQCAEVIAGLIPEFADMPTQTTPVAKVALRRAILRRTFWQGMGFWLVVATALLHALLHVAAFATADPDLYGILVVIDPVAAFLYAVGVVCMIANCIGAVLWARESSFAVNRCFMQISNGGLGRESISFPRQKIQFGSTRTNPFQRMAKTATIRATIAAGVGGTTIALIDVAEEDAARWLQWLEPRK